MKKGFFCALVLTLVVVNVGFAGSPDLEGTWVGTGRAIVPFNPFTSEATPTVIPDIVLCGVIAQDGSLIYGTFEFEITNPEDSSQTITAEAFFTGNISENKRIQGIMSLPESGLPLIGIGLIDGKWNGKTIIGVARDFTDGSTTYLKARRGECPINGD